MSVNLREKIQEVANGLQIFASWPLWYEYQRPQWQEKAQHLGQYVGGYCRCQEAFCILECLLCRDGPIQRLGPPSQEISQRTQHLCAIRQKKTVKIHHAEKTLQLFDVLRGWAKLNFGSVIGRGGRRCCRNRVAKNFQRGHCKNTFFKIDGETIGGQGVEKSFQMAEVCLPVRRTYSGVVHVCKHTFHTVCGAVHHSWKVCAALDSPNGVNKYSNKPNGVMIAVFEMSAAATGIWW